MAASCARFSATGCLRRLSNPLKENKSSASRMSRLLANCRGTATCAAAQSTTAKPSLLNKSTNFVQTVSRNVQISRRIQELSPVLSCNVLTPQVHSGSSSAMEETSGEGEEEATSGRKRPINWPDFLKDDP